MASRSNRSSSTPTRQISPPATSTPRISDDDDERAAQRGQLQRHQHGGRESGIDGDPAHPRDRQGVHVPVADRRDRAEPGGEDAHDAGEQERQDKGGPEDERVLPRGNRVLRHRIRVEGASATTCFVGRVSPRSRLPRSRPRASLAVPARINFCPRGRRCRFPSHASQNRDLRPRGLPRSRRAWVRPARGGSPGRAASQRKFALLGTTGRSFAVARREWPRRTGHH